MRKNTRKAILVATLGDWIEAGRIKKPSQLAAQAERPKKKQCTRTNRTAETPTPQTLRPTVGVKEPRKELSVQQPASKTDQRAAIAPQPVLAAESSHSCLSSDDNRSSDSDFNPQESKGQAKKRKTTGSSVEDTPSSQSEQAGDDEIDSPQQVQRQQPKQPKASTSNAAATSALHAPFSTVALTTSSTVSAHHAETPTAVPSPSPSDCFHRLPCGYLPACQLTTGGGVVFCVQGKWSPQSTCTGFPQSKSHMLLLVCVSRHARVYPVHPSSCRRGAAHQAQLAHTVPATDGLSHAAGTSTDFLLRSFLRNR